MLSTVLLLSARLMATLAFVAILSQSIPGALQMWDDATSGCAPAADEA
ncbi:MAG: hypothetical protein AB9M60_24100 [Leptothrix sp. (in: b-proteobacteria)]